MLEHILLRTRDENTRRTAEGNTMGDFYAHRVSIVFPAFTARFADPGCRAWLEELISQQLPAHILPDFYWLDFALLAQFELRYRNWLELLNHASNGGAGMEKRLDTAAEQLIDFLNKAEPYRTRRVWL